LDLRCLLPAIGTFGLVLDLTKKRSVGEQVKSGLQIGFGIVLAIVVAAALIACSGFVVGQPGEGPLHPVLGAFGLVTLSVFLFFTAPTWSKWLAGFFAIGWWRLTVFALIYSFFQLILNQLPWEHLKPADAELFLILTLVLVLLMKYGKHEPKLWERIGLVVAVVGCSFSVASRNVVPSLAGLSILSLARLATLRLPSRNRSFRGDLHPQD
jgi:hypothetical protein